MNNFINICYFKKKCIGYIKKKFLIKVLYNNCIINMYIKIKFIDVGLGKLYFI